MRRSAGRAAALAGGRRRLHSSRRCGSTALNVASYNLLTQPYTDTYQYCSESDLCPDSRANRIMQKVGAWMSSSGDVLCLQEVSLTMAGKLHKMFEREGYHFVHSGYGPQASDNFGVGIAWKKAGVTCDSVELKALVDTTQLKWPAPPPPPSMLSRVWAAVAGPPAPVFNAWSEAKRRRNLVATVRLVKDGRMFTVACYHMPCLFGSDEKMQVVNVHTALLLQHVEARAEGSPYVVAGDFNLRPNTSSYQLMQTGSLAGFESQRPRSVDGFECSVRPVRSVYEEATGSEPLFTTHAFTTRDSEPFTGTLDYIWVSNEWRVESVLSLPTVLPTAKSLPTEEEPSDHLMIGAHLRLV